MFGSKFKFSEDLMQVLLWDFPYVTAIKCLWNFTHIRLSGRLFEPHRRHSVVSLSKTLYHLHSLVRPMLENWNVKHQLKTYIDISHTYQVRSGLFILCITLDRGQSKTLVLSTNVDQNC